MTLIYVEEDCGSRPIEWANTAVAGFIGFTEDIRGGAEISKPILVKSWVQYLKYFASPNSDGFTDFNAYLPLAVYGYFLNGGTRCWITSIGTGLPERLPDRSQPVQKQRSGVLVIPQCSGLPCLNPLLRPEKTTEGPLQIVISDTTCVPPPTNDQEQTHNSHFFTLLLKRQDEVLEQYEHLTMDSTIQSQTATYVVEALEPSEYITIQDIAQFNQPILEVTTRPKNGEYELYPFLPTASYDRFAHEVEGDRDRGTGVRGIFTIDEISTVAFPDLMRIYEAGILDLDRVHGIMELMVSMCETSISGNIFNLPRRMVLFDPPPDCVKPEKVVGWLEEFGSRSMFAALYYPWIEVHHPRNKDRTIFVPPCGHTMGVWASIDKRFGVYKAPTNVVTEGAIGLAYDVNFEEQERLNSLGINCICKVPDQSIRILGARTLVEPNRTDGLYISVQRLISYIEKSIKLETQWVVFERNDYILWERVWRSTYKFLERLWRARLLVGETREEAFFVKCDAENNTPETIALGHLYLDVGVASVQPGEFARFRIRQSLDLLL